MTDQQTTPPPQAPPVFVSYAWDDREHCAWVVRLATRLRSVGIDVELDRWDTSLGSDLAIFMEQVASPSKRVLAVVSDQYREKSDDPRGGVGYEKRVIAPTIMADLQGDRIVPILRHNSARTLPRYMGAAKYLDFTDDADFEDRLYELVSELYGRPVLPKPELGPNPFAGERTEAQVRAAMRHRPERYSHTGMSGAATFDYSNNSGKFTLGAGSHTFTLEVSSAGHGSVHVYRDPADIATIALKPGAAEVHQVGDGVEADASSRSRTVRVGDAAVLQNQNGYWAAVLVDKVLTRDTSPTGHPSLSIRFHILPSKSSDFSSVAPS